MIFNLFPLKFVEAQRSLEYDVTVNSGVAVAFSGVAQGNRRSPRSLVILLAGAGGVVLLVVNQSELCEQKPPNAFILFSSKIMCIFY